MDHIVWKRFVHHLTRLVLWCLEHQLLVWHKFYACFDNLIRNNRIETNNHKKSWILLYLTYPKCMHDLQLTLFQSSDIFWYSCCMIQKFLFLLHWVNFRFLMVKLCYRIYIDIFQESARKNFSEISSFQIGNGYFCFCCFFERQHR